MDKKKIISYLNQKISLDRNVNKKTNSKNTSRTSSTFFKRKKRSESDLKSATDVLQALLDGSQLPLSHSYQVWKLRCHWKDVVGETISEHSRPLFYIRGTLYIWSENSVWTQEFIFLSETIKQKINDYVGKKWVRKLRFQLQEEIY